MAHKYRVTLLQKVSLFQKKLHNILLKQEKFIYLPGTCLNSGLIQSWHSSEYFQQQDDAYIQIKYMKTCRPGQQCISFAMHFKQLFDKNLSYS